MSRLKVLRTLVKESFPILRGRQECITVICWTASQFIYGTAVPRKHTIRPHHPRLRDLPGSRTCFLVKQHHHRPMRDDI